MLTTFLTNYECLSEQFMNQLMLRQLNTYTLIAAQKMNVFLNVF